MRSGRTRYLLATCATIALGLFSRAVPSGIQVWDKSLGDALYAAYLGLSFFLPGLGLHWRAFLAISFCFGIEAFKLTGLPQAWASSQLSRLVFGTTPSLHNIVCYFVGVLVVASLDSWSSAPSRIRR